MSDFTATIATNSTSPIPNPPQVSGDFGGTADGTINGHATGSFPLGTPKVFGTGAQVSVVGWNPAFFWVVIYGSHPQNYFSTVSLGAPANLSYSSAAAVGYSNSVIPGYTYWSWTDATHEFSYIGQTLGVTFGVTVSNIGGQGDITNPGAWEDSNSKIPPAAFSNVPQTVNYPRNGDGRYWFTPSANAPNPATQSFIGDTAFQVAGSMSLQWTITQAATDGSALFLAYALDGSTFVAKQLGPSLQNNGLNSGFESIPLAGTTSLVVKVYSTGGTPDPTKKAWNVAVAITRNNNEGVFWDWPDPFDPMGYNGGCIDEVVPTDTLVNLRTRILRRIGFSAQALNPPPGMKELVDDFLISGQKFLYKRYSQLHTRRFFRWKINPGQRFYSLMDNDEDVLCNYNIDVTKTIEWVGVQDNRNVWYQLIEGIKPDLYTMIDKPWRPARYEIRQTIEIYPAPDQTYWLWMKAHFGLRSMAVDADKTTIDAELVFLHALANAKAHYGQPDANNIESQANAYRKELIAGTHGTNRYVPGVMTVPPAIRPTLIQFTGNGP